MDTQSLLLRYARYYECLQKLGQMPLSEIPTLEGIQPSKGIIQSGYKEIKEGNFDGNFIDYLCFVSMQYLVHQSLKTGKGLKDCLDVANSIVGLYESYPADVINLLRLFNKKPELLFDLLPFELVDDFAKPNQIPAFTTLNLFWYDLRNKTAGK